MDASLGIADYPLLRKKKVDHATQKPPSKEALVLAMGGPRDRRRWATDRGHRFRRGRA
jgi:hypothetical protein